jgi:hypothetical protein
MGAADGSNRAPLNVKLLPVNALGRVPLPALLVAEQRSGAAT